MPKWCQNEDKIDHQALQTHLAPLRTSSHPRDQHAHPVFQQRLLRRWLTISSFRLSMVVEDKIDAQSYPKAMPKEIMKNISRIILNFVKAMCVEGFACANGKGIENYTKIHFEIY